MFLSQYPSTKQTRDFLEALKHYISLFLRGPIESIDVPCLFQGYHQAVEKGKLIHPTAYMKY